MAGMVTKTKKPRLPEQILADLQAVREDLESCDQQALRDERNRLWDEARRAGIQSRVLADASNVESVTVRLYWDQEKVAERARVRKTTRAKKSGMMQGPDQRPDYMRNATDAQLQDHLDEIADSDADLYSPRCWLCVEARNRNMGVE